MEILDQKTVQEEDERNITEDVQESTFDKVKNIIIILIVVILFCAKIAARYYKIHRIEERMKTSQVNVLEDTFNVSVSNNLTAYIKPDWLNCK